MKSMPQNDPGEPSSLRYQITVKGALIENWADWFNGMLISTEHNSDRDLLTTLTCQVRDQAELIGIINWLHNMNLILEQVHIVQPRSENPIDETKI